MEVTFPNLPEVIREFRIWWINASIGKLCLLGGFTLFFVLAWQSPKLLKVYLEHRQVTAEHNRRAKLTDAKLARELERRAAKAKPRKGEV